MNNQQLTRREAGKRIGVFLAAAGTTGIAAPLASAQRRGNNDSGTAIDNVLSNGRERRLTFRARVHLQAWQRTDSSNNMPVTADFAFNTAAVVFPVIKGCASMRTTVNKPDDLKSEFAFDEKPVDTSPKLQEGYPAGTRLARWETTNKKGNEVDLKVTIPMVTWSTTYDHQQALKIAWPASGAWPAEAASTFTENQAWDDARLWFCDHTNQTIRERVDDWTNNKPRSQPPALVAKWICKKVVENFRVSGDGVNTARNGAVEGIRVVGAELAAKERKGSEHDLACYLTAAYRAAGIPARPVIGFSILNDKDPDSFLSRNAGSKAVRSWVEFCLYDQATDKHRWIPVDPAALRNKSSRVPSIERDWDYFGTHKDLQYILPLAFQFHPPTSVVAHGSPALYGWFTTPRTQVADQWVNFEGFSTPNTAEEQERRRRERR